MSDLCDLPKANQDEAPRPWSIEHEYEAVKDNPYSPLLLKQIEVRDMRKVDGRFFKDKKAAVKAYLKAQGAPWEMIVDAMREVMKWWDVFFLLKYGVYDLTCWVGKGTIVNIDPTTGEPYDAPEWYERMLDKAQA